MFRRSFFVVLPLLAACAAPVDQDAPETSDSPEAMSVDELTAGSVFVRIAGTCFQTYAVTAVNTGARLRASKLVFKPGQENAQFGFCGGTDRVILRGSETPDGNFKVDGVWMQQSGPTLGQNVEVVRALRTASGETFERALNATEVRRVSFQLGSQSLSTASAQQFATGKILFAGPRGAASSGGGGGGYGQPAAAAGTRRVDAVFQEIP